MDDVWLHGQNSGFFVHSDFFRLFFESRIFSSSSISHVSPGKNDFCCLMPARACHHEIFNNPHQQPRRIPAIRGQKDKHSVSVPPLLLFWIWLAGNNSGHFLGRWQEERTRNKKKRETKTTTVVEWMKSEWAGEWVSELANKCMSKVAAWNSVRKIMYDFGVYVCKKTQKMQDMWARFSVTVTGTHTKNVIYNFCVGIALRMCGKCFNIISREMKKKNNITKLHCKCDQSHSQPPPSQSAHCSASGPSTDPCIPNGNGSYLSCNTKHVCLPWCRCFDALVLVFVWNVI